jgi:ferrous iron transport protein A
MLAPDGLIPLSELPTGILGRLERINGGRQLTRRLWSLGLREGSLIIVLHRRGQGLVVASNGVRIAIGAGIADKLWIRGDSDSASGSPHSPALP